MILTEYEVIAYNKVTEYEINLGIFISQEDAWNYIINGIDWQPDANKREWMFQVNEVDIDENITEF